MVTDRPRKHRTLSQKWRAVSLNNKLIVVFSGVTMFATVVYTFVAERTLREIHAGSADTHALAVAAKAQAEKMKSVSDAAEKIQAAAENMVTQDQRIADNAKSALDASNRNSKAALDATIDQNRLDQRPWIGIGPARVSRFDEKKPITVEIQISNSGKTPALNIAQWSRYKYGSGLERGPLLTDTIPAEWHHVGSTPPQGNQLLHLYLPWDVWVANLTRLTTKQGRLLFFGEIAYDDVGGAHHRTQFCVFMADPESRELPICDSWGDMN